MNKANTSQEEFLAIKNLTYSYSKGGNKTIVLENLNAVISKGEMVALVGPSGSGKTTLLNLIGLLDELKNGKIYLEGKLINPNKHFDRNEIRLHQIGFVFQFHRLLPEFSARENIAIPQMITGLTKNLALKRSDELLEMMGIYDKRNNRPGELSGGEQQRVAIARAIAGNRPLLLADEPTGNLDIATGNDILALFKRLCNDSENPISILMVTHDPALASKADRMLLLRDGVTATSDIRSAWGDAVGGEEE